MNIYKKFAILIFILIISMGMVSANEDLDEINLETVSDANSLEIIDENVDSDSLELIDDSSSLNQVNEENAEPLKADDQTTKSFLEISNLIKKAKNGDTIYVDGVYQADNEDPFCTIELHKSITIQGPSNRAVLDAGGNGLYGMFYTHDNKAYNLTLKNLIIKNHNGYCIYLPKGNVVVSNCIFRDNIGDMEGSVIRATNINIQNSQFINNFANSSDSEGGIIVGKTINAKNSVFTKNRAYRGSGGAINGEKVTCTNCNFTSNSVSGDGAGGAIATRYANIQNCNFVGNKAGDEGGAILFDHKNSVIKNSIFKNNYAKLYGGAIASCGGFNMNNCSFSNNHAAWYGGAIYIASTGKTNKIYNTVFTCNHAKYGGAIYLSDCANLILSKSTFKNNYANYAGALYLEYWASSSTVCKIIDCKFVKNYKKTNKIAIYTGSGDLRIIKNGKTKKIPMEKLLTDSFKAYDSVIVKVKKVYALYKSKKYIVIKFYNGFTKKLIKKGAYDLNFYNKRKKSGFYGGYDLPTKYTKKGFLKLKVSKFKIGNYGLAVLNDGGNYIYISPKGTYDVRIFKNKAQIKAPKISAKHKKSKYFKVTLKQGKNPIKKLKVRLLVYTGKKYKKYTIKTNNKGIAKFNTKKLKVGAHKVFVEPVSNIYLFKANTKITIKK